MLLTIWNTCDHESTICFENYLRLTNIEQAHCTANAWQHIVFLAAPMHDFTEDGKEISSRWVLDSDGFPQQWALSINFWRSLVSMMSWGLPPSSFTGKEHHHRGSNGPLLGMHSVHLCCHRLPILLAHILRRTADGSQRQVLLQLIERHH